MHIFNNMCILPDCNPRRQEIHLQFADMSDCLGMRGTGLLQLLRILLLILLRHFHPLAPCVQTLPQAPYRSLDGIHLRHTTQHNLALQTNMFMKAISKPEDACRFSLICCALMLADRSAVLAACMAASRIQASQHSMPICTIRGWKSFVSLGISFRSCLLGSLMIQEGQEM